MVPQVGFEPTLFAEEDFESSASTGFATGARILERDIGIEPTTVFLEGRCSTN